MKKFISLSLLYWSFVLLIILMLKSGRPTKRIYYHGKVDSTVDLVVDLFKQKDMNGVFETYCDGLQYYGSILGYTYQEMNFVVFVIFQPAFILYFFLISLLLLKQPKKLLTI